MKMFRGNFEAGGENTDFTAHMHLQFAIAAEPQYAKYAGGVIGAGGFDEFDLIAKVGHGKNSLYNVDEFRDYMNVELNIRTSIFLQTTVGKFTMPKRRLNETLSRR